MKKEIRFYQAEEIRTDEAKREVSGYAAVFHALSELLWTFREKIAPGAFKRSLEENDVVALWSHNSDFPLGRTSAKTLDLREDDRGLHFALTLPRSTWGDAAFEAIRRNDVKEMSFGFNVRDDHWERGTDGSPHIRTLLDIDLIEVSPTVFPAYPQTSVSTRDAMSPEDVMREQEAIWAHQLASVTPEPSGGKIVLAKCRLAAVE